MPFPSLAVINNVLDLYLRKKAPAWNSWWGQVKSSGEMVKGVVTGHSNDESTRREDIKTLKMNAESASSVNDWVKYCIYLSEKATGGGGGTFSETCNLIRNYVISELTREEDEFQIQFKIKINEYMLAYYSQKEEIREARQHTGKGALKKIAELEETIKTLAALDEWKFVDKAMQRNLLDGLKLPKAEEIFGYDFHESRPLGMQAESRKLIFRKEYQAMENIHMPFDDFIAKAPETLLQKNERLIKETHEAQKLKQKKLYAVLKEQEEMLHAAQQQRKEAKEERVYKEKEKIHLLDKIKLNEIEKSARFPSYTVINDILNLYIIKKGPQWNSPWGKFKGALQKGKKRFTGYGDDSDSRKQLIDEFKANAKKAQSVGAWMQFCFDLEENAAQASGGVFNETCHLLRNYIVHQLTSMDDEIHAQIKHKIQELDCLRKNQEEELSNTRMTHRGKGIHTKTVELAQTLLKLAALEDWASVDKAIDRKLITHLPFTKKDAFIFYEHPDHIHESRPVCWQEESRRLIFHQLYQQMNDVNMSFDTFVKNSLSKEKNEILKLQQEEEEKHQKQRHQEEVQQLWQENQRKKWQVQEEERQKLSIQQEKDKKAHKILRSGNKGLFPHPTISSTEKESPQNIIDHHPVRRYSFTSS